MHSDVHPHTHTLKHTRTHTQTHTTHTHTQTNNNVHYMHVSTAPLCTQSLVMNALLNFSLKILIISDCKTALFIFCFGHDIEKKKERKLLTVRSLFFLFGRDIKGVQLYFPNERPNWQVILKRAHIERE